MTSANTKKQVKFLRYFLPGLIFSDFEKNTYMKVAGIMSVILIAITIATFGIIFSTNSSTNVSNLESEVAK